MKKNRNKRRTRRKYLWVTWFAIFTPEKLTENPILIISMTEDVKGRRGSGYVVEKDKMVLEEWFRDN